MGKDRQLGWRFFQLLPLSQMHWLYSGDVLCSCASLPGFAEKKHLSEQLGESDCSLDTSTLRKGLLPLLLASAGYLVLILSHFFQVASIFGRDILSNSVSSPCSSLRIFSCNWTACSPIISFLFSTQRGYK